MNKKIFTTPEELLFLDEAVEYVNQGNLSLRQAVMWLEVKTGRKITYEGLRKIILKRIAEGSNGESGDQEGL